MNHHLTSCNWLWSTGRVVLFFFSQQICKGRLYGKHLGTPCFIITVHGHLKQSWPEEEYDYQGLNPSGVNVWLTPLGKPARPAEVITEDEEHLEWITSEENEYQLQHCDQLQQMVAVVCSTNPSLLSFFSVLEASVCPGGSCSPHTDGEVHLCNTKGVLEPTLSMLLSSPSQDLLQRL